MPGLGGRPAPSARALLRTTGHSCFCDRRPCAPGAGRVLCPESRSRRQLAASTISLGEVPCLPVKHDYEPRSATGIRGSRQASGITRSGYARWPWPTCGGASPNGRRRKVIACSRIATSSFGAVTPPRRRFAAVSGACCAGTAEPCDTRIAGFRKWGGVMRGAGRSGSLQPTSERWLLGRHWSIVRSCISQGYTL